jgi:hypothetical protein
MRSPAFSSGLPAASLSKRTASRRLFGLAPAGVYRAVRVATNAVGSYPTFSPLPTLSRGRFVFCGTVRHRDSGAQALPGSLSMEPGLSSKQKSSHCAASLPLNARSAAAFDGALASRHGSRLLTLRSLFIHKPAVAFLPSPTFRKVFTDPAETACPSRCERSLCPAFQRLSFG